MAQGNAIILESFPYRGKRFEGLISGTPKPGTVMQLQAGTARDGNGHYTYEAYSRDADGDRPAGPFFILDANYNEGKTSDDAYADGDLGFLYCPLPGDEFNLLLKNISGTGTGDEVDVGDILLPDSGTGKLIRATGSSESPGSLEIEPFIALEAETDVTADTLIHVQFTGY